MARRVAPILQMLATGTVVVALSTACGNVIDTKVIGSAGFALDDDGSITIMIQPCRLPVDEVDVIGPIVYKDGVGQNSMYLRAASVEGQTEPFSINNFDVEPPFKAEIRNAVPKEPDTLLMVNAFSVGNNAEVGQVSSTLSQIESLQPGEVIVGQEGKVVTEDEFLECQSYY